MVIRIVLLVVGAVACGLLMAWRVELHGLWPRAAAAGAAFAILGGCVAAAFVKRQS